MQDLISMVWRRLPLVMTIMVLGVLVSFYLIVSSPRVYQASAVIQLDMPAVMDQGADSSLPASRRVQLIEQRLMARANLRDVIQRLGLFADTPGLSETEKLVALRNSTRIESITAPGVSVDSRLALAAIVITSQAETANMAAAIANDFADSVVNRDRENRKARILESQDYLRGEEARLNEQLSAQERKVVEYSARNEDALPSSQTFLQTELAQLSEMETTLNSSIMDLQRERLSLEAGAGADARPSASLVQQIRSAEIELAQARRTLAADHPEIKRLEDNLQRLNSGGGSGGSDVVRRQAELIDAQLLQLNQQKAGFETRRIEIDRARARVPQVTRELEAMQREQRRLQDRYNEISRQLAQVETQQMLMENDQTERFVLLERALPPEYPALSNRKKSAVMGVGGSFALAMMVAFVLELLNPVLRRTTQFARATGTRPVIALPYRLSPEDLHARRLRQVYLVVLLVVGALVALWLLGKIPGLPSPGVVPTPTDGMG
ncbi:GumC family protein [Paracoccus sp. DMF]|uniref:GumC family protein n=1 Tax=Paracoccus sp. DMF TaxID=400837 RepID=UPI0021E3BE0A|nr:lipopolysaccharide biosynthesis protein [Paracoccus sp. DMF]